MGLRVRGAGAVLVLFAGLGCSLETSGIAGTDGAVDVEVLDESGGDWVPGEDARREDSGEADDVGDPDDAAEPDEDSEVPVDVEDDGGGEDDGGPIPDGCAVESCNGLDDDCDGRTDDGFECVFGTTTFCGSCAEGRWSCTESCVWSACTYPAEVCAPGTVEECTPSSCEVGHRTCEPSCRWTGCVADHGECTPGATQSCTLPSCGTGSRTCLGDCTWSGCAYDCSRDGEDCCPGIGCVNLDWDANNCGSCGNECGFASGCWDGHCSW